MALRVVTLSLVLRAISSKLIPLVWRIDATVQLCRGNVAMPSPVISIGAQSAMLQGRPVITAQHLVFLPHIRRDHPPGDWRPKPAAQRRPLTICSSDPRWMADRLCGRACCRIRRHAFLEGAEASGPFRRGAARERENAAP